MAGGAPQAVSGAVTIGDLFCFMLVFHTCLIRGEYMNFLSRGFLAASLVLLFSTVSHAQLSCRTDSFGNTNCNNGGGWRTDSFGNIYGTGNNAGSGYRTDSFGNTYGAGSNSGAGWRTDTFGNTYGTGSNSGGGWRTDSFGNAHGTGLNSGITCRRDSFGNTYCN